MHRVARFDGRLACRRRWRELPAGRQGITINGDVIGDPATGLQRSDSITIPGVTPSYLEAHLQSLVHLR
jgi:hypothetical protein